MLEEGVSCCRSKNRAAGRLDVDGFRLREERGISRNEVMLLFLIGRKIYIYIFIYFCSKIDR